MLGFNSEHDYFGKSVHPVVYSDDRPPIDPFEHRHSGDLFYAKSKDWEYEQEYRKFQCLVDPIKLPNGNKFLPYTESSEGNGTNSMILLFPFPKDSVTCVILGWKATAQLHSDVTEALKGNEMDRTPIYKALPSPSRYQMDVVAASAI